MLHHYPGIYAIRCTVNDKQYVGSAFDIQRRWWTHRYQLRHQKNNCRHLQSAWNKYGEEAFEFLVLEPLEGLTKELKEDIALLIAIEQFFLDTLQPEYNIRKIADRNDGVKMPRESVERVTAKIRGLKRSPEFSANMSKIHKGRQYSEATIKLMKEAKANTSDLTRQRMSDAKRALLL